MYNGYCEATSISIASLLSIEFQAATVSGQAGQDASLNTPPRNTLPPLHTLEPALQRQQGFLEDELWVALPMLGLALDGQT